MTKQFTLIFFDTSISHSFLYRVLLQNVPNNIFFDIICYNITEQTFISVTFPLLIVEVKVELKTVCKNRAEIEDALLVLSVNAFLNDVFRHPYY